VPAACLE